MIEHTFKYDCLINDRKVYIVRCYNTTGSFSTKIWDDEKYPRNKCICCGGNIKKCVTQ